MDKSKAVKKNNSVSLMRDINIMLLLLQICVKPQVRVSVNVRHWCSSGRESRRGVQSYANGSSADG